MNSLIENSVCGVGINLEKYDSEIVLKAVSKVVTNLLKDISSLPRRYARTHIPNIETIESMIEIEIARMDVNKKSFSGTTQELFEHIINN